MTLLELSFAAFIKFDYFTTTHKDDSRQFQRQCWNFVEKLLLL